MAAAGASAAHCLSAILLDDLQQSGDASRSWIMLLPEGEYEHPKGTLKLNRQMLSEVKKNFDHRVRGVDIALDYDHKASDGDSKAFGWIENIAFYEPGHAPLKSQPQGSYPAGLWALVRWTTIGLNAVRDEIYRYISAEYRPEWTNPVTKKTHRNVLVGATLTNRPFMNQMPAVQLSDEEAHLDRYAALFENLDGDGGVQMSSVRNVHMNKLLAGIGADDDEDTELDDDGDGDEYDEGDVQDDYDLADDGSDAEPDDDEATTGEFPATQGRSRNSARRRPGRTKAPGKTPVAAKEPAGSREMSEQDKDAVSLAEANQMRERIHDLSLRLFEAEIDNKIKLWETAPSDGAGSIVTTKAFNDEYRAFMLSEGFGLSETTRKAVDKLLDMALKGTVELGQRSLAAADMESRQTRSAGQGDDRQVVERIEAIALEEYRKSWKDLQVEARRDPSLQTNLREIVKRAWRETGYDPMKLSADIARQGSTRLRD